MLKRSLSGGIYVHPWDITFSLFHPHLKRVSVGAAGDNVRHHSFHDYGMSRRHELAWIGDCRDAWSEDER
jgi:hypothetical protein